MYAVFAFDVLQCSSIGDLFEQNKRKTMKHLWVELGRRHSVKAAFTGCIGM